MLIARADELHRPEIQVLEKLERPVTELPLNHQFSVQLDQPVHPQFERARIGTIANLDGR
jgi:hypothetical protein